MKKAKNILLWTGASLAAISSAAYLGLLYIIIAGFKVQIESTQLIMFLGLGALFGVLVSSTLRIQGIDLAKNEEESKRVLKEYNELVAKDKTKWLMPMWLWMTINIIKDIVLKGFTIMFSLYFSITIIIEGLGDMNYFILGVVNVFLYGGFGMFALAKAYDHYIENQIPLINQKINRLKEGAKNDVKQVKGNTEQEDRSVRERRSDKTVAGIGSDSNGARGSLEEGSGVDK